MRAVDVIGRKRDGLSHTASEIRELVSAVTDGSMPDYQAAAWLMAAYLKGLDDEETLALTLAMRDSGRRVDLSRLPGTKLDKHSSGGVGDKTTLVVVPLLAAAGIPMLKMSGRGLGFSGGTIDKLESIAGFRTDLSLEEATAQVEKVGAALIGQSPDLAPADKKLYGLRDVTATVDSLPLITASIMSKKLAGGADAVLLDVKVGRGAFVKTLERARALALGMVRIGEGAKVKTVAALTNMDEPLGYSVGNALEVREACDLLSGKAPHDRRFRELCILLTARGLMLGGKSLDSVEAISAAESILESGQGADKLEEIIGAQGGNPAVVRNSEQLSVSGTVRRVRAEADGFVGGIDAEAVGRLCVAMGGGRAKKDDDIDRTVGIVLYKKVGAPVSAGQVIADLHLRDESGAANAADALRAAYEIASEVPALQPTLYEIVGE